MRIIALDFIPLLLVAKVVKKRHELHELHENLIIFAA